MDIHKIVEATLRVTEEEMTQANQPLPAEPMPEEMPAEEPIAGERPEITPELVAQLTEQMPELAEVDVNMLINGINVEMEHFDTVGGDVAIIAKVAFDHMKEFPNADYYAALAEMESGLSEPAGEEVPSDVEPGMEPEEVETITPKPDSPFEKVKK